MVHLNKIADLTYNELQSLLRLIRGYWMNSTDSAIENTTQDTHDTATKIKSPIVVKTLTGAFYLVIVLAVIITVQLFTSSLDYFSNKAQLLLEDNSLSTLYPWIITLTRLAIELIYYAVGLLIFMRKRNDRIGMFTAYFMIFFGAGGIWWAQYTPDPTGTLNQYSLYLPFAFGAIAWLMLFTFVYIFPDGRIVPRWVIPSWVMSLLLPIFWGVPSSSEFYAGNWDGLLFIATHGTVLVLACGSQVYRYRHISSPIQRQQTKWVVSGLVMTMVLWIFTNLLYLSFDPSTIAYDFAAVVNDLVAIIIPISLAFAMLRSRLWDIDLIINRSLVYAIVAGVDLTFLFGAIVGLQLIFGQTEPIVAIIIALVLSLAVYRPLSHISRQIIDRRVYHLRFQVADLHKAHRHRSKQQITNAGDYSGKTFGKYQILDVIGKGGMGEVYKAESNGKTIAIKTLLSDKADDPELITRFQREAEAGQTLQHPNIAHVYDIGAEGETIYMVMDYLEGRDLSSWLKEYGTVSLAMAQDIMRDLSSALDYAHAKGFIHRDIKPSNIMLVPNRDNETYRTVLMDFGITKIKDANTLTGTGAVGTIDYMAPEQIMDAKTVDHRADIYALGIVLYEMIVGKRPFTGGPGQVLFAHLQQPAPDPRDTMPDLPRPIARTIMKALEKSPDDRFDSAVELMQAFDKVIV